MQLIVMTVLATVLIGCDEDPTAPETPAEPDPPAIPTHARLRTINVTKYPEKKTDGSHWDLSLVSSSRRPDIFVGLRHADSSTVLWSTDHYSNVSTTAVLEWNVPPGAAGGGVVSYGTSMRIYVWDHDADGAHDTMGWITLLMPRAYDDDEAETFDHSFTNNSGRITVRVRGEWRY
jgi:hypothetical protein